MSSLLVARKARTPINSSKAKPRMLNLGIRYRMQVETSQVVSHYIQPQVGINTPSSGMALVRMSSKPYPPYHRQSEASGTASLTMCREPTTRKWLRIEQLRKESSSIHQNSVTYLDRGEVTYASQVQDVLIPYTTREDTYNYYEERNYVNDINREHTEFLETYDHDGKAREIYSYGKGRASYLNNQTGDSYNYLENSRAL